MVWRQGKIVTSFVVASATSMLLNSLLCNPKIIFALAQEGHFPCGAAWVDPRWKTLVVAIVISQNGDVAPHRIGNRLLAFDALYGPGVSSTLRFGCSGKNRLVVRRYAMPLYPLPVMGVCCSTLPSVCWKRSRGGGRQSAAIFAAEAVDF